MDGFTVAEDDKGENGDPRTCLQLHTEHRRSKSASGRNSNLSKGGVLHSIHKGLNLSPGLPASKRKCNPSNTIHGYPINDTDTASSHIASLEKDVEKLQLRLQQEKSMRLLLERAVGRASSTLSPGHRHSATQTEELISEIESLEEEVADREQHVLSLYRSIFENCASRPLSEQNSGITSPAHTKVNSRKHPSIISSAFCSSKKIPLPPFHGLSTINDSGKRNVLQSKIRHVSLLSGGKANVHFENSCSGHVKVKEDKPTAEKTSVLRTLKDHLYQCPSKLSEEMVRCMAAVYCWLRSSNSSANTERNRSPLLSRSSTSVVLPQRGGIGDSCKSMVEISWISTYENNFSHASYAINDYRVLVEQLEKVNLNQMETNARTAFWINIYNSLVMHAYLAYGIPHNSIRRLALFHKAAYKIGGHIISANAIEQSIFCFRTPRVGRWLETILSAALRKKSGEERHQINSKFGLMGSQSLVCFTLCTGAFSDPVLKVYSGLNIKEELEMAKKEFLLANIVVKRSRKVFLPKLLERYAKETSVALDDLLKWVTENVDKKLRDSIKECMEGKTGRKASQIIEWLPYNSRFRYVFSKNLTEKPWWL